MESDADRRARLTQRLGDAMSDLQQRCFYASWMCATSTIVGLCRRAIQTGRAQAWGDAELGVDAATEMWSIAEELGGWAEPDDESEGYSIAYPFTSLESDGLAGEQLWY